MDRILNIIKRYIPKKVFRFFQPGYHWLFSWLSAVAYGFPSNNLIVIGVTGTTGKTTAVYLIAKMLESAGYKVGYTSTAMFSDGKKEWLNDKKMTMVGRFFVQKIIKQMLKNGCQYAIIETTSEGIRQFRHQFINYDILVFTGLYPEHIESHGSFEKYRQAKEKLFAHLKTCQVKFVDDKNQIVRSASDLKKTELNRVKKTIIVNGDDENHEYFLKYWAEQKFIISNKPDFKTGANEELIIYKDVQTSQQGTVFKTKKAEIKSKLLGDFNATNAMFAFAIGLAQGVPLEKIKSGLEKVAGIPGRLERIDQGQNFTVIVDYAFEPKALEKLYKTIEVISHHQVIHVLGSAGGGRDIARRPKLGELAGQKADYVIVTNEDPYDDDPQIIIDQVSWGAEKAGKKNNQDLFKILDREQAIKKALELAGENDIVLVTGKGSEQAICVAHGQKIPWDDRGVVKKLLRK